MSLIGDFPPPVTGASKNNERMANLFSEFLNVSRVNTAGGRVGLRRSLKYHIVRAMRVIIAISTILFNGLSRKRHVYHVPNAGWGGIYTLALVMISIPFAKRIVLHHRGYSYIDCYSKLMACICKAANRSAIHVFLSEGMKTAFKAKYGEADSVVFSNVSLLDFPVRTKNRRKGDRLTIGHLSNLCPEKGFQQTVETFEILANADKSIRLLLAGPFIDKDCRQILDQLKLRYGDRVEYLGPVFGQPKIDFYDEVDIFLFPTCYSVEAEPNVVWEALARGCVTVAYARGCISEMLPPTIGLAIDRSEPFAQTAVPWIQHIFSNYSVFSTLSSGSIEFVTKAVHSSSNEIDALVSKLVQD